MSWHDEDTDNPVSTRGVPEVARPQAVKRKLIEVPLPLDAINREAAPEKSVRHGHPSTLHLWWDDALGYNLLVTSWPHVAGLAAGAAEPEQPELGQ